MATRALQIRNAMVAALKAAAPGGVPSERIFTDLRQALQRGQRPAIVVDLGDEDTPGREYGKRQRAVTLTVRLLADGADPFAAIDPIRTAVHAVMMADKTVGGLADNVEEGGSSRDRADLDVPIGALTTVYSVKYTTTGESLA